MEADAQPLHNRVIFHHQFQQHSVADYSGRQFNAEFPRRLSS
jgi:hypothetical protein